MNFTQYRPDFPPGKGDSLLPRLVRDLKKHLLKIQRQLAHDTLRLRAAELETLAQLLVEMAEDLHNDIGLWRALEQYHHEFFNVPLPLTGSSDLATETPPLAERLAHFMWIFYAGLDPTLVLSPTHSDLRRLADSAANFLAPRLARIPRDSGVKHFLTSPGKEGWDIKRKLVGLGTKSYLFRLSFQNYIAGQEGQVEINTIDDFICQHTTAWAGLGAIDILAGVLDLSSTERSDLRHWYERHAAFYRVERIEGQNRLHLTNLISETPYVVRMDGNASAFKPKQAIYGSLTPWHGTWCWSGVQKIWKEMPADLIQQQRRQMQQGMPGVVYRYDKKLLAEAEEMLARHKQMFVDYHGDDLAVFPDGKSMAAAMQDMYNKYNKTMAAATGTTEGMPLPGPSLNYPPGLVNSRNGVAVYFNPGEGVEIVVEYNNLVSGLQKRGRELTEDEVWTIQGVIQSEVISPQFMQRLAAPYGPESIAEAFLIRQHFDQPYLDYLLRRYKGEYYRRRYPNMGMVDA